jgi:hypothetical protein
MLSPAWTLFQALKKKTAKRMPETNARKRERLDRK